MTEAERLVDDIVGIEGPDAQERRVIVAQLYLDTLRGSQVRLVTQAVTQLGYCVTAMRVGDFGSSEAALDKALTLLLESTGLKI